jgi:hypothetical protein
MNPSGFSISTQPVMKACFHKGFCEIKIPLSRDSFKLCGERGIRTPGTVTHTAV